MIRSRNIAAYLLLVATMTLLTAPVQSSQSFQFIHSSGTITYPSTFIYRGTNVGKNQILVDYESYVSNAFEIFQDLSINMIIINYGTEGGNPFNINLTPNWAQNLENLLATCDQYGVKVVFQRLGNPNNDGYFGIKRTLDVNVAKSMVDKLAGNNSLSHNFLTDHRIAFWIIDNEPSLSTAGVVDWLRAMGDYFLSHGANVACVGGYIADSGNDADWIPVFAGHQNFIVIHHYHLGICQNAQNNGQSVYNAVYPYFKGGIDNVIAVKGNIPLTNVVFGEAGLGHEPNFVEGTTTYHFTETTRGEYYRALFQSCEDSGISGLAPYLLFDAYYPGTGKIEPWGAVALNGTYFQSVTDQYKAFYLPPQA